MKKVRATVAGDADPCAGDSIRLFAVPELDHA
jgi:hypothetical protein